MKLPIYIEASMGVFLVVILAMAGRNGMIPQNQKNNVMKQSEVEQKSDSDMQNEKEAVAEEATDSIEEVAQTDSAAITAQMCSPAGQYPVMGEVLLRWMNLQIISINRDTNIRRKNWQKVEQIP